ncbi:MAG: family 43 glycosylhydrolase [Bacteroidaceae bacterium]|nr:family 43 glycosylhydrolase [Bacteroidaceae bacterium]
MKRYLLLITAALLTALSTSSQTLRLHYDLSKASVGDTSIADATGHYGNATLQGHATVATFKKETVVRSSIDGWIDMGESVGALIAQLGDCTFAVRLYISSSANLGKPGHEICTFAHDAQPARTKTGYLSLSARDSGWHLTTGDSDDEQAVGSDPCAGGAWHTFVWTLRQGLVRHYVDGQFAFGGQTTLTPSALGRTTVNRLFCPLDETEAMLQNVYLADFRIYDGALSSAAVAALSGMQVSDDEAALLSGLSFDETSLAASGASLQGSARCTEVDGLPVLDLGDDDGYLDLGTSFGDIVAQLNDFTLCTNLCIPSTAALGQAGNFVFTFANSADIASDANGCVFLGANQTRYAISPTHYSREQAVQTGSPIATGIWQHVAYRQRQGLGTLFIDGLPVASDSVTMTPSALGTTTYNFLGRSCYRGDVFLKGAQYHDLRIYGGAATDEQIIDMTGDLDRLNSKLFTQQVGQAQEALTLPVTVLYDDIDLPTKAADDVRISWSSSDDAHLTPTGKVTRPAIGEDTAIVVLTATLSKRIYSSQKAFTMKVVPRLDDAESVRTDRNNIVLEGDLDNLKGNLRLPTVSHEGSLIFWRSSDARWLSNEGTLRQQPPQGEGKHAVTLTATLMKGTASDSLTFDILIAEQEPYCGYLFAYFTGNAQSQEQICFALSTDGYNYTPLNEGKPIIASDTIALKKAVRDPHILRGEDGWFYMVVTDMKSSEGWSSNDGIVLMRSHDLLTWTHSAIDFPDTWPERFDRTALTQVWAPQTIYDPEAGKYMVYYSIGEKGKHYTIWYSYANDDFTALEEPQLLYDHGANTIDADIVFSDGLYHMFFKTEGNGNGIQKATAPSLHGPWTAGHRYLQQTNVSVEGSGVFPLIGDNGWVLMYDCYTSGHYQFCHSADLETFSYVCDTKTSGDFTPRHGTVIPITTDEADRLIAQWPSAGLTAGSFGRPSAAEKAGNPILPDFHADPEVLYSHKTGRFYVYTTTDGLSGWAGSYFTCYSSADLKEWVLEGTVVDLASAQVLWASGNAWAPAIEEVREDDGGYRYYFYFSGNAGSRKEIGVATATSPTGPFTDKGESIIRTSPAGGGQQIDVDVFTDPVSGKPYIYWGNGYMAVAELNDDRTSLKEGTTKVITPSGGTLSTYAYREAPYVFYRNGIYYFLWSVDDTGSNNYHVAYGTSSSPTGPIKVANDPIVLIQSPEKEIYGTAHNSVLQIPGRDEWYIVYHRINKNWQGRTGSGYHRETCIDRMYFNADGTIQRVVPTHEGPAAVSNRQIATELISSGITPWAYEPGTQGKDIVAQEYFDTQGRRLPLGSFPDSTIVIRRDTYADNSQHSVKEWRR